MSAHPFVPGARVAVVSRGWGVPSYREAFVEKVHKNGNFTLGGDARRQQWKPSQSTYDPRWRAYQTGGHAYSRDSLLLWNEEADAEIAKNIALSRRQQRLRDLQKKLEGLRVGDVTDEMLDAIAAALAARSNQETE